jgi:hypothetical protein
MPDHMYRFRSIESLLGTTGRAGELEEQYIFFAASETLNDPLEGYRETYWSGDSVLWQNLLRHYVSCLTFRIFQYLDQGLVNSAFPINVSPSDQSPELISLIEGIAHNFLSDSIIKRHIKILSFEERRVNRSELQCHLQMVQKLAFVTSSTAIHNQYTIVGFDTTPVDLTAHNLASKKFLDNIEDGLKHPDHPNNPSNDLNSQKILSKLNEINFNTQYHQWKINGGDPWFELVMSFPEDFCKNLGRLNFPNWYVACFMSECTDSSIWGTYGNNHSGACLKFKTNGVTGKRTLPLKMPTSQGRNGVSFSDVETTFHKVSYEENFVEIDFFASLGMVPSIDLASHWFRDRAGNISTRSHVMKGDIEDWRRNYHENYQRSITVKLGDWKRENEYRLTMHAYAIDITPPKNRTINYDFNSLDGIIFGINTSPDNKMKIITIIEKLCLKHSRKEFNFYQARYDNLERKIKCDPIQIRDPKFALGQINA